MGLILLVEDDAALRDILSHFLTHQGYSVPTASDGFAALDLIQDSSPDLILLDIYLPGLDGRRFAQAYRERPGPHAPILVLTGAGYAGQRAAALEAAGCLAKPIDLDELDAKVKQFIGPSGQAN